MIFLVSSRSLLRSGLNLLPNFSQALRPRIGPALGTVLLLLALNLLNYIDRYILSGEVSPIQHEFHATDQQMGALATAFFFFYMFAAPRRAGWATVSGASR